MASLVVTMPATRLRLFVQTASIIQAKQLFSCSYQALIRDGRARPMQQMTKSVNESQMRRTFEQVMLMLVSTILYLLDILVDSKV